MNYKKVNLNTILFDSLNNEYYRVSELTDQKVIITSFDGCKKDIVNIHTEKDYNLQLIVKSLKSEKSYIYIH